MTVRFIATTSWNRWAAQARSWVVAMTVLPAAGLGLEQVQQVLLGRDVDPGHRLVEEVQLGRRREGAGEEDPPALAARERTDLGPGVVGHADLRQRLGDRVAIGRPGPAERPEGRIATHHHDVPRAHREVPVDGLGLGHVGDPPGLHAGRRAEHVHLAGPRLEQAGDDLEQRALAAAVRAEDRRQAARPEHDVDVVDRRPWLRSRRSRRSGGRSGWPGRRSVGLPARGVVQRVVVGGGHARESRAVGTGRARSRSAQRRDELVDVPVDDRLRTSRPAGRRSSRHRGSRRPSCRSPPRAGRRAWSGTGPR